MAHGVIGFRTGTPKLKTLKGFTWASALQLVKEFLPGYVRQTEEIAKDKLLADRDTEDMLPQMAKCGIQVAQDETFLCRTKERRRSMKNHVTKEPKIALCRKCHGKGKIVTKHFIHWKEETCPQM